MLNSCLPTDMFFTPLTSQNIVEPESIQGPPNSLPVVADQHAVLHRSDVLAAAVWRFEVYSEGFEFALRVEGLGLEGVRFHSAFDPLARHAGRVLSNFEDFDQLAGAFRVGVEFSDGSVSENHVRTSRGGPEIQMTGSSSSTGNGYGKCQNGVWVPQLPPPGEFKIHLAWPNGGLDECSATFDADELIAKSKDAIPLLSYD